ncbi:MAG: hypothetical protein AAGA03_03010 [Planctomycetota bacterium]
MRSVCFAITCLASVSAFAAGTTQLSLSYTVEFAEWESDGSGGSEMGQAELRTQHGGALNEHYRINPLPPRQTTIDHLNAFSSASAVPFGSIAFAPSAPVEPPAGEKVGGHSQITVAQVFRKDEVDATFSYQITAADLAVAGIPGGPTANDGLESYLKFSTIVFSNDQLMVAPPIYQASQQAMLFGHSQDYILDSYATINGQQQAFEVELHSGGLDQNFASASLTQPYSGVVDLDSVPVGSNFTVVSTVLARSIDHIQFDSRASTFGRDPLDPNTGMTWSFNGLTPIAASAVPEPSSLSICLLILPYLVTRRRR